MTRSLVLIVEDDAQLNSQLAGALRRYCRVHQTTTMDGAETLIMEHHWQPYDLILLDRCLQNDDALDLLPLIISDFPNSKVCIMSQRDGETERIRGLAYGADDYLVKPFSMTELIMRVQNLLRRGSACRSAQVAYADLWLCEDNRMVHRGSQQVRLTKQQVRYLHQFMTQPSGLAYTRGLAHISWTQDKPAPTPPSAVHVMVQRLRKKLAPLQVDISNRYGLGYQLVINQQL